MALVNNKKEAMDVLRQACEQFRGTKQDHIYIDEALRFIDEITKPIGFAAKEQVEEEPQAEKK